MSERVTLMIIHEIDLSDRECRVIGVETSREDAKKMITEYYGTHTMTDFRDVRDSGIDFDCVINSDGNNYKIIVQDFTLNEV